MVGVGVASVGGAKRKQQASDTETGRWQLKNTNEDKRNRNLRERMKRRGCFAKRKVEMGAPEVSGMSERGRG
ncbi:uncharacterized protein SPSK_10731 [Sporothrix schenckii 1099-18]|uniref:Uncharacterized protein n=1 Tax=Sporothrix schenckii 1099-18 TaxID=1397361 RepID=A0A0F2MI23_SPOSC|nr:uncharacterized protein SPSK_10731 [Sporothrix schenckii 1099-18]KJR89353.1 hypothetical protein SPSK_10731 [Sporothrix schenckii 1099-18]